MYFLIFCSNKNSDKSYFLTVDAYVVFFPDETQHARLDWQDGSAEEISVGYHPIRTSWDGMRGGGGSTTGEAIAHLNPSSHYPIR